MCLKKKCICSQFLKFVHMSNFFIMHFDVDDHQRQQTIFNKFKYVCHDTYTFICENKIFSYQMFFLPSNPRCKNVIQYIFGINKKNYLDTLALKSHVKLHLLVYIHGTYTSFIMHECKFKYLFIEL